MFSLCRRRVCWQNVAFLKDLEVETLEASDINQVHHAHLAVVAHDTHDTLL
jgi:hypothetical protein